MRKVLSAALLLATIFTLASCSREVRAEHCELGILLPSGFELLDAEGAFDLAYSDGELTVGITRVSFAVLVDSGISATLSPREFAAVYRNAAGISKKVFDYGDTAYYSYTENAGGISYRYTPTFIRTPYAYFIITFIAREGGAWDIESALALTAKVYLILNEES